MNNLAFGKILNLLCNFFFLANCQYCKYIVPAMLFHGVRLSPSIQEESIVRLYIEIRASSNK